MPLLAVVALLCFAANSVLARVALRDGLIDPATFTAIRLLAGALVLALLARPWRSRAPSPEPRIRFLGALLLFLYAAPFSFAYLHLTTGTGALILFGAVQLTMIGWGLRSGERPRPLEWFGLAVALTGFIALNLPGLTAPPLGAALLMTLAGVAWGGYSLRGRGSRDPRLDTAWSFILATPLGLGLALLAFLQRSPFIVPQGILYATISGALASGGGYAAWYAVLPRLSATRAGTIQLAVPVLTAVAGAVLLAESFSVRLILCGAVILGGIGLSMTAGNRE